MRFLLSGLQLWLLAIIFYEWWQKPIRVETCTVMIRFSTLLPISPPFECVFVNKRPYSNKRPHSNKHPNSYKRPYSNKHANSDRRPYSNIIKAPSEYVSNVVCYCYSFCYCQLPFMYRYIFTAKMKDSFKSNWTLLLLQFLLLLVILIFI